MKQRIGRLNQLLSSIKEEMDKERPDYGVFTQWADQRTKVKELIREYEKEIASAGTED